MPSLRPLSRPVARLANPSSTILRTQAQRCFSAAPSLAATAIVTGAARGIGKAIATRLAHDGFNVCINDIDANKGLLEETAAEISSLSPSIQTLAHVADIRSAESVNALVSNAVSTLGPLNVMVANAGIVCATPLVDISDEEHRTMFDINYFGTNNCYRAASKQFIKQGKPEGHPPTEHGMATKPVGSKGVYKLIGCASIAALRPAPLIGPYSTSKWAVRGLTHAWALEMAQYGITANSYAPGIVGTAMWDVLDDKVGAYFGQKKGEYTEGVMKSIALGRLSVPEDVAKVVSFLAGGDSDYMTGQMVAVDGGCTYS